jgi:hypothetical protein
MVHIMAERKQKEEIQERARVKHVHCDLLPPTKHYFPHFTTSQ